MPSFVWPGRAAPTPRPQASGHGTLFLQCNAESNFFHHYLFRYFCTHLYIALYHFVQSATQLKYCIFDHAAHPVLEQSLFQCIFCIHF